MQALPAELCRARFPAQRTSPSTPREPSACERAENRQRNIFGVTRDVSQSRGGREKALGSSRLVVGLNAIRLFLLWEGLETLQRTRAKGAPRAALSSPRAPSSAFGKFTDNSLALESTSCPGIYAEYSATTLNELLSSQGIAFESAHIAPAAIASRQG